MGRASEQRFLPNFVISNVTPEASSHPKIKLLLDCIDLEEKEQIKKFGLAGEQNIKALKAEGLAIQPISIIRKNFGYADYPEIAFKVNYPVESNNFRDGGAIECFYGDETPIKGTMLFFDGKNGEFRLYAPDFPYWIEDHGVGLKLAPNHRTNEIMKSCLEALPSNKKLLELFDSMHGDAIVEEKIELIENVNFNNTTLNESQQNAVNAIVNNKNLCLVHGPPGTGKTTTLIASIMELIARGEKILVSAPSNAAVDNIAQGLLNKHVNILRVGNTTKVDDAIFPHTPEGKLNNSKELKEIKALKIRAEEFRKMAHKYKRSYGKAEREQQNLLFKEVKSIRAEIKKLQSYNEDKLFENAAVILGTPIGLYDAKLNKLKFDTLLIDEAGQCIEPLAWCIFPMAEKIVLAGDHLQLPPTVLSNEAAQKGLNVSILEVAMKTATSNNNLLNTQYRMRESIAGFSNAYFYEGKLLTPTRLSNTGVHVKFIDTAGSGFNETQGSSGLSLQNEGELRIAEKLIELELENDSKAAIAFISPYSGQVLAAKNTFSKQIRVSTIDSFQGQEQHTIIISLVRSNDDGEIGFLKDYRRMNVALTRAKEKLLVIGDSATLGSDKFYHSFLDYVQNHGEYASVWELDVM